MNKIDWGDYLLSITAFKYLVAYTMGCAAFFMYKPQNLELNLRLAQFMAPLTILLAGCLMMDTIENILEVILKKNEKKEEVHPLPLA